MVTRRLSTGNKLLLGHAFSHIMLIPMFIYGSWWMWIGGFIWWQVISITAISSGYHRYAAHGSFTAGKWYEWYFNIVGIFANPGPVITWAAAHRLHHIHADTACDPHSPIHKGWWQVYSSYWGKDLQLTQRSLSSLAVNETYQWFRRHYFKLQALIGISMLAMDSMLFLFGFCLPMVIALHGYGLINAWAHRDGHAQNSVLANILSAGEGWHKNHHDDPMNWRIGKRWFELDIGAWFIRLIKTKPKHA